MKIEKIREEINHRSTAKSLKPDFMLDSPAIRRL